MDPFDEQDTKPGGDLDTVFRTMSHTVRRRILTALLTDNLRWKDEFESPEFRPADTEPESVRIDLHHVHLPKLDDAGFIDWDPEMGQVTRGTIFEEIRPLLELMDDRRSELPGDWP